jgi:hypothetical protein
MPLVRAVKAISKLKSFSQSFASTVTWPEVVYRHFSDFIKILVKRENLNFI